MGFLPWPRGNNFVFEVFPAPASTITMSSDIAWAVTRNNSAFLLKKRGCPKPFSTDPLNLTNKNSQRYNGYLHKKAVGIAALDKGFAVSVKKPSRAQEGRRRPPLPEAPARQEGRQDHLQQEVGLE